MADAETLKLDELAEQAGVSVRTVRYYVQRGLLPAPVFRGKDTAYGRDHLVRLRAIARLQAQFLPLDAIQEALAGRSLPEIERLADGREVITAVPPPSVAQTPTEVVAHWERVPLAQGLELHVAEDASREVKELARRIRELSQRSDGRKGDKS